MLYHYAARLLLIRARSPADRLPGPAFDPGAAFFVLQLSRRHLAALPVPEAVKKFFQKVLDFLLLLVYT